MGYSCRQNQLPTPADVGRTCVTSIRHLLLVLGFSSTFGPVTAEITHAVEAKFRGRGAKPIALAYALYNVAYSIGTVTGPFLGGFVRQTAGWPTMGWSLAIISATTSVLCATFIGGVSL